MLPTAQQDPAVPQHCSPELHPEPAAAAAAAAAPCHTQHPCDGAYFASTYGPHQACYSSEQCPPSYSRSLYAAASEANSSQHHPFWDVCSQSPGYTVAAGRPVSKPTAPLQGLTSPSLVSTHPPSEVCQTQAAAAVPVQQQQHPPHREHKGCTGASPGQIKDSRQNLCLRLQTSCHSSTVPALKDSPCLAPAGKPCPAVFDTSTVGQSTASPTAVECQQHSVCTDMNMLAGTEAHHDIGQVLLPQGCCLNAA